MMPEGANRATNVITIIVSLPGNVMSETMKSNCHFSRLWLAVG